VNPALRGEFAGGLLCRADAIVEPRQVLPALRGSLAGPGYEWLPGREVTEVGPNAVRDHTGTWYRGDLVILCPGAAHTGVAGRYLARGGGGAVRRVRLQMMQTAPLAERITTALADGDSLRYYPAYDLPGRTLLPPQAAAASPSVTHTNTPSRSRSTWTPMPMTTCRPAPSHCSARPSRRSGAAGPACTARSVPVPRFITGPSPSPASYWSLDQAAGA